MATFETASKAMAEGKKVRRADWPECKVIRSAVESDRDYFYFDVELEGLTIEDCKKNCDCQLGLWVPENDDKESDDWIILNS